MSRLTGSAVLRYDFCAVTDRGRVRANNEDSVAFHASAGLALLADGMGGYNAGEVAAAMATSLVRNELALWLAQQDASAAPSGVGRALAACIDGANRAILDASLSNPAYTGMGTTLVVAAFHDTHLALAHIGDSRCYRLRDEVLEQITKDHSWLQEQIDAGLMTPQQAAVSGCRNLVTRALGVDLIAEPDINEFEVRAGDLFILCSDGLTDMVDDEDIASLACIPIALEDKAQQMVSLANARGGRDNVSVVLVQSAAV